MKKFFVSFLGTMAGIWVSAAILIFGFMFFLIMSAIAGGGGGAVVPKHSVLYLDLSGEIVDYPQKVDLLTQLRSGSLETSTALVTIVEAIEAAAEDDNIDGMVIECNGVSAGLAQLEAIRKAVKTFKGSEKWVYAYGDEISQGDYFVACHADSLFINPCGGVDIHGLASQGLYFKGLLDKLGVKMQVIKVGTYKSAVEPYILTGPSEANVEQQTLYLNNIWGEVASSIAEARNVSASDVKGWASSLCMAQPVEYLLENHIVDAKVYRHAFLDKIKALTDKEDLSMVTPSDFIAAGRGLKKRGEAKIGVYYAEGEIFDAGESGIIGQTVVENILALAEEDDLDALVLRVNSPGGSAFASEQIWEALQQWKAMTGKPLYVSMGDYAASGGYYISCGADKIYAEPVTITGSIGIFGLIPDASGLLNNHLGVTIHSVGTNPNAVPINMFAPMTAEQTEAMQAYVNRGYDLFVSRVAEGRGISDADVRVIAEGRVWDGREALNRKLVDELGGLSDAIAGVAEKIGADSYQVVNYPTISKNWWEPLMSIQLEAKAGNPVEEAFAENPEMLAAILYVTTVAPLQARMPMIVIR